jgi:dTDP-3-amino-3,4,6-trideoxy-alpha-D-glucose transaminase
VEAFEQEFAQYCGVRHCVGVGNGTDALALILRACEVGAGDEVIVPAYTAVATWMAVSMTGATPVGVDVCADTCNIDPAAVEEAVSARTRAVVPVHLFGQPADLAAIEPIAARHSLVIVEDAAQAHGARHRGALVGGLARAASFSFYPTKNLGAMGDGGAITTDDDDLADRVRLLRSYGWRSRSVSEVLGVNTRLDELQAALLRVKLEHLDDWNALRRARATQYADALGAIDGIRLPLASSWCEPVWHQFVVGVEHRHAVQNALAAAGVETLVHYDPLPHLTPAYRDLGWSPGSLPRAEWLADRALSLPMYPQLAPADCDRVVGALKSALGES